MQPAAYLDDAIQQFRKLKELAEKAILQVDPGSLFATLDAESNSIAAIMKHLAGNMRSRWTDFLTSDGEKPGRQRDQEFASDAADTKESLLEHWEAGWRCLFGALSPLAASDLSRIVLIRGEPHSVMQAINRQLTHYAYHVGQIVLLAKHFAGAGWQSLSIPRGHSEEFTAAMRRRRGGA
ncbi:MAG TPA: DUF1572 family protein [Candidatus Methylomirabilis sp.]|nr:DUF1572 family protein [Candidatus Methylomirabilis sp.]